MELREDQKEAMESILSSSKDNRMVLFQAPTGWGKTVLIADLAVKLIKQGKNVIVITLRNDLVAKTIETIEEAAESYIPVAVVGRTNYIMVSRAIDELVKIKKNVKKNKEKEYDKVMEILKNANDAGKPYLFISDIENKKNKNEGIAENEFWVILKYLALPQNDDKIPKLSDGYNFVVTNMFYLAHYLIKRDDDIKPNTVVLLDEADYFADNIRSFFNTNCSFYTIKVISDYLYLTRGDKIFEKLSKKAEKIRNEGKDINRVKNNINAAYESIISNIDLKFIDKILTKKYLNPNNYIDKSLIRNLVEVRNFIKRVGQKKDFGGEYKINFSSIRQYVSIERTIKFREALGYLSKLWKIFTDEKDDRKAVMLGATIASPTKFSNEAELKKDIRENKLFLPISISFDYLSAKPSKKNAIAYLLEETAACHYNYDDHKATDEWIKTVVDTVKTTYKTSSNALIMCKSRETAKEIAGALEKNNFGVQIYYDKNSDIKTPLNAFKSSNNGGIFVSHAGLSVGMDISDISQLYIAQIPNPPPGPGQNTKERDFIQWIGRLRDNKKEIRGLYVIDSRIWKEKNLLKIIQDDYLSTETINIPKPKEVT